MRNGNSETSEPWNGNERIARRVVIRSWKEKASTAVKSINRLWASSLLALDC